MARLTHISRRKRDKFPPEYGRWVWIDDLPSGARGRDAGSAGSPQALEAWQLPTPRKLGKVVMASGIVERGTVLLPPSGK